MTVCHVLSVYDIISKVKIKGPEEPFNLPKCITWQLMQLVQPSWLVQRPF